MQYGLFFIFLALAFVGAYGHYWEKRYAHKTTGCSFKDYVFEEGHATLKAIFAILASCGALVMAHSGGWEIPFSELSGAIMVGYGFDNMLNKAPE